MTFLDTSGVLCFLQSTEDGHHKAVEVVKSGDPLLTHDYVLAEFVALANVRRLPRKESLEFTSELHVNAQVTLVEVDRDLRLSALRLLRNRLDKFWSLCDAVSFLLMMQFGVRDALTTDHHFEQAGFVRLIRPE